jgi:3-dehydroquinate synthase
MKITKPKFAASEKALIKLLERQLNGRRYVLLTDEVVSENCLSRLAQLVIENKPLDIIEVEPGESGKTPEVCLHLWNHLIELEVGKGDVLVCIGGGSITDLGGFIASTYKRGMGCVFVPTTLLAMTDAAIGGKNGLDSLEVKNVIGTIVQPEAILIYAGFCSTLSNTQFLSGMAEVYKHGVIAGGQLWNALESLNLYNQLVPSRLLKKSIALKLSIVKKDPYEYNLRRLLNFGHTIGHAIESAAMKAGRPIEHGIAVAFGMLVEWNVAIRTQSASNSDFERFQELMIRVFVSEWSNVPTWDKIEPYLRHDKKIIGEKNVLALPFFFGNVQIVDTVSVSHLQRSYNQVIESIS